MSRQEQNAFYGSPAWKNCRRAYYKKMGGLCELCYAQGLIVAGEIVHHKQHLSADNLNNPAISLNPDNLQLLCRKCHAEPHPELYGNKRYSVDKYGNLKIKTGK